MKKTKIYLIAFAALALLSVVCVYAYPVLKAILYDGNV